ncbi:MAG: cytochrome c [Gammaproteobacteria bacterium]|nr:cytochrome c [Gammaproteobacteria bacterium]
MAAAAGAAEAVPTNPPDTLRRAAVVQLVRHDCGSCHGITLKGGLGPALTREALDGKSPEGLRATILYGRPGTPMPPWRDFLTEAEAGWVVEVLMQGRLDAEK